MQWGRWMMGGLYMVAGVGHFVAPRLYEPMIPGCFPAQHNLVLLSGVAEIAGGAGVLVPKTRRAAAWGIILLLVAVSPANLEMARHPERWPGLPLWALWLRIPLQLPLMYWAWRYTRRSEETFS